MDIMNIDSKVAVWPTAKNYSSIMYSKGTLKRTNTDEAIRIGLYVLKNGVHVQNSVFHSRDVSQLRHSSIE